MTRAAFALGLALALTACGDDHHQLDAGPRCTAAFTGNFADASTSPDNCARLDMGANGAQALAFTLAPPRLDQALAISIDLGAAPAPGTYSSQTLHAWTARGYWHDPSGGSVCEISAGGAVTPTGSFSLSLATADGDAHGRLELDLWILSFPGSVCGTPDTEHLVIDF